MRGVWEIMAIITVSMSLGAVILLPGVVPLLDKHLTPEKREEKTILIRAYIAQHGGFEPKIIKLRKGEKVEIAVEAMDLTQGFAIDELGIDLGVILPEWGKKSFELKVNKSGIYTFRTSIINGPMTPFQIGYIIVEGENEST